MTACPLPLHRSITRLAAAALALGLAACGGGSGGAVGVPRLVTGMTPVPVQPTFHMAPVDLPEPPRSAADVDEGSDAARPAEVPVSAAAMRIDTARLSAARLGRELARAQIQSAGDVHAMGTTARVYTPGQIRAAYALPPLATALPHQLGAGQTIYIVIAFHNPTIEADLAAFNERFGLPGCRTESIDPGASLPLAPAPTDGCVLSVVHATQDGGMSGSAPSVNDGWTGESALDVQWAHAMAPMARIVLVQAVDHMSNSLLGAIALANRLGPGVVNMSWGTNEGSWTTSVDEAFATPGMTYLAATGDDGVKVSWPSVSPRVIGVGGTTMNWSGSGARSEVAWSRTGGGVSAYTPVAPVQAAVTINGRPLLRRAVADLSFNADPYTGQYVAQTNTATNEVTWRSYGGTSISSPQWAGLLAVANAVRAYKGVPQEVSYLGILYRRIANDPASLGQAFADIAAGRNGPCPACPAVRGYDIATGWGTPRVPGLMPLLTTNWAPVIPPTLAVGSAGKAYALQLPPADLINGAYGWQLSGPDGLRVDDDAGLRWDEPVPGRYTLTLSPTAVNGATTSATRTLVILAAPALPGGTWRATRGRGFSVPLNVANGATGALTYGLAGAPRGLVVGANGVVSWPSPVAGTYTITVTARNAAGVAGSGSYTLVVV